MCIPYVHTYLVSERARVVIVFASVAQMELNASKEKRIESEREMR